GSAGGWDSGGALCHVGNLRRLDGSVHRRRKRPSAGGDWAVIGGVFGEEERTTKKTKQQQNKEKTGGPAACRNAVVVVSNAPELAFEFLLAEEQGGGPAVRAVVGVIGQRALLNEGGDFLFR